MWTNYFPALDGQTNNNKTRVKNWYFREEKKKTKNKRIDSPRHRFRWTVLYSSRSFGLLPLFFLSNCIYLLFVQVVRVRTLASQPVFVFANIKYIFYSLSVCFIYFFLRSYYFDHGCYTVYIFCLAHQFLAINDALLFYVVYTIIHFANFTFVRLPSGT